MEKSRCRFQTSLAGFIAALLLAVSAVAADAATLTVTNTSDGGGICPGPTCPVPPYCPGPRCTLRQAIATATAGDAITFSLPANSTIYLNDGELLIDKNLTINGPGANLLTVQRSAAPGTLSFRIFNIEPASVNATISGLTIANGESPFGNGGGGGIHSYGTLALTNSTISGNGAVLGGGGIDNSGTLTITNSTISGNAARDVGGGIDNSGTLTITNSTISGNSGNGSGEGGGGGIYNTGTLAITNSTISGNSADFGGGGGILNSYIFNISGTVTITNSTISGNSAYHGGGGILNMGSTVNARNTIIAKNTDTLSGAPDYDGSLTSQGFNLIGNTSGTSITGTTTGNQLDVTPPQLNLGPLQDNGGPTFTHALLSGSFAIDRGHSSGSTTDQRGFTRLVDDPGTANAGGGDGSDIGAYEVQAELPPCNTVNRIVNNNNDAGTDSLRAFIANVCAGSTITFAANVSGSINLTSGELLIDRSLTISGPGANVLSVQRSAAPGTPAFRIFNIAPASVTATISGLTIANGNAFPDAGGGIRSYGTLTLTNVTISANAALNGGGIWNDFGTLTITDSTLYGNAVSSNILAGSGGGIFNHGGTVNITNSTISGNSAIGPGSNSDSGGGILTNVGTVSIASSTISGNRADFGGGIRNVNGGVVSSKNTIIALNTSVSGPDVNGPLASQGFNLISNAAGAVITPVQLSDQIGVTPAQLNLGPLRDNGGPTKTHALLSGSFATDKGHSSGSTIDQRGFTRPVDNPAIPNATDGDGSDIGSYEFIENTPKKVGLPWLMLLLEN